MIAFFSTLNSFCKFNKRQLLKFRVLSRRVAYVGMVLATAVLAVNPQVAFAETTKSDVMEALASAEEAYQRVDFDTVYREAMRGLEIGGANAKATARLHSLIGISAAALGKDEDARSHFVVALALTPGLNLERGLSPRIRGPYMEAKGFWEAYQERIKLESSIDFVKSIFDVSLDDPARIAAKIRIHIRTIGEAEYETKEAEVTSALAFVLPPGAKDVGVEVFSHVLDKYENTIYEDGTFASPKRFKPSVLALHPTPLVRETPKENESFDRRSSKKWLPIVLSATGIVSLGVGAVFSYRRETLASEWNSSKCEKPGDTRLSQCGETNSDRKFAERAAIGFYSAGGLLLLSGIITYVVDNSARTNAVKAHGRHRSVDCNWQIGEVFGASCAGKF
jgi:hypothetical protein